MSQFKNAVIGGLTLALTAGTFLAWRQHGEIERLSRAGSLAGLPAVPAINLHAGAGRHFTLMPRASSPAIREEERPESPAPYGIFRGDARATEAAAPRSKTLAHLIDNPEFIQALDTYQQGTLDARFATLFRRLNLTAAELATFKRLLAEKENVALDVFAVSETTPQGPLSPAALRESVSAAQAQVENAIESSLGSDRYAVYREYEATAAQRATVAQLEQRLSYSDTPLTPAQVESLVRILVVNAPEKSAAPLSAVSVVVAANTGELTPVIHASAVPGRVSDQAVVAARQVLGTEQVTALREIQDEQQAAVRASELIRETYPIDNRSAFGWRALMQ